MDKNMLFETIDARSDDLFRLSDEIWDYAETAFSEHRSVGSLARFLRAEGFDVEMPAYGVETAVVARYGSGRPCIGLLGEFDALANLAQDADVTVKQSAHSGGNGHGCGHNLLGVGALAAAIAVKQWLAETGAQGTVIYYGCPGEEGGSGKAFMARGGAFKDLDCALTWHPSTVNAVAFNSSLANTQVLFSFKGRSAHAAGCPEMGRSALDALELMNVGVNFLREHMPSEARVHYAIVDAGGISPNVVQASARAVYLIRSPKVPQVSELFERVVKIAAGAALMTETEMTHEVVKSCANMVSNRSLEQVLYEAMLETPMPAYAQADREAAAAYSSTVGGEKNPILSLLADTLRLPENKEKVLQAKNGDLNDFVVPYEPDHPDKVGLGSTDVGDTSWQCPTAQINACTWAVSTPGHSWQVVAQGKSNLAHQGMLYAGKVLALAATRL
ncbi:MAG TPA: amidohydrolase, partial [Clostridia bacterium]|nr:amidohydrolase [Clostridia bacterium]